MKGSISRNPSSGTYYARVDAGVGRDGKRKQLRLKARTRKEIEAKVAAAVASVERGRNPVPSKMTIGELLDLWLATKSDCEFRTRDGYRSQIELYLRPDLGHFSVSQLRSSDVQRAVDKWKVAPRLDGKMGTRSARTVHYPITVLSMAMRYARALDLCFDDPVRNIVRPRLKRPSTPHIDAPRAGEILRALHNTDFFVPIWLAFSSGLRREELLGLRVRDIDLERRTIDVQQVVVCRGRYIEKKAPKTVKSLRCLPISNYTCDVLRQHMSDQRNRIAVLGIERDPNMPLFDDGFGRVWHPDNFGAAYRKQLRRSGVAPLKLHGSRHGFTSLARSAKVGDKPIADLLGHESTAMTERYGSVDMELLRFVADSVTTDLLKHVVGYDAPDVQ